MGSVDSVGRVISAGSIELVEVSSQLDLQAILVVSGQIVPDSRFRSKKREESSCARSFDGDISVLSVNLDSDRSPAMSIRDA